MIEIIEKVIYNHDPVYKIRFCNGKIIIDGCFGDFFTREYGTLKNMAVIIEVENGRAVIECICCNNEWFRHRARDTSNERSIKYKREK